MLADVDPYAVADELDPSVWGVRVGLAVLPSESTARWDVGHWDFEDHWDDAEFVVQEATRDVISLEFSRGRRDPLSRYQAATASLRLYNPTGRWSPWLRLSAGFVALDAGVPLTVAWDDPDAIGRPFQLYTGRAEELRDSFTPAPRGGSTPERAWIELGGSDAFAWLARNQPATLSSPVGAGETSGARILRILQAALWPADSRIDATAVTVQGTTHSRRALDEMYLTADSALAELYVARDGRLCYESWDHELTDPRQAFPQVILTDRPLELPPGADPALPLVGYAQVEMAADRTQLVNVASVANVGGSAQTAQDPLSIGRFGPCTWQRHDLIAQGDGNSALIARLKLARFAYSSRHLDSVTVDLGSRQSWASTTAARRAVCGLELGDRVRVLRHYPSGQTLDLETSVDLIRHRVSSTRWEAVIGTGRTRVVHSEA